MKTKNIILGFFALVLAAGSAFASLLVPTPVYVKAKVYINAPITCEPTGVLCDNSGFFPAGYK